MNIEDSALNFPLKCMICKNIINQKDELNKHSCFCNYPNISVDDSGYVCPQLEDIEELLISNVKKRRELWDYRLPLTSRSRDVIAKHWQEVSKELNGILTPEAASKKWRYLKDSYMRIRNDMIKKKSGSAASKVIKWKWYEFMEFLHDIQDLRSTTTNYLSKQNDSASSEISGPEDTVVMKKRRTSDNEVSLIMKEPVKIDASSLQQMRQEATVSACVPTPVPLQDNISHIMKLIENVYVNFQVMKHFLMGYNYYN
ncbi:PREDICTED: uncharacterized protein LOC108759436 [Trachymyrmex cornetzi]|uniref:uncharacterized protein LOC108759436 n=1 Tax=Trachymyrmex cornetzi TaxID=471704 RepID=UPI00084EF42A|nr:PREDICTED: uncharacterized protein LOC108759436 [Trachymyrmex cornetzi]